MHHKLPSRLIWRGSEGPTHRVFSYSCGMRVRASIRCAMWRAGGSAGGEKHTDNKLEESAAALLAVVLLKEARE